MSAKTNRLRRRLTMTETRLDFQRSAYKILRSGYTQLLRESIDHEQKHKDQAAKIKELEEAMGRICRVRHSHMNGLVEFLFVMPKEQLVELEKDPARMRVMAESITERAILQMRVIASFNS